ncbi:MAG: hypothetical protein ACI8W7_000523 [Gammaproteobacteria bacterium]
MRGVMPAMDVPAGVAGEACLNELADAFYSQNAARLSSARQGVLTKLGAAALIDAAGIIGIFEAVVRVADATGIPLEDNKAELSADFRTTLGIDRFHADKS